MEHSAGNKPFRFVAAKRRYLPSKVTSNTFFTTKQFLFFLSEIEIHLSFGVTLLTLSSGDKTFGPKKKVALTTHDSKLAKWAMNKRPFLLEMKSYFFFAGKIGLGFLLYAWVIESTGSQNGC